MSNVLIFPTAKEAKEDIVAGLKQLILQLEEGSLETNTLTLAGDGFTAHLGDVSEDMEHKNAVFNMTLGIHRLAKMHSK